MRAWRVGAAGAATLFAAYFGSSAGQDERRPAPHRATYLEVGALRLRAVRAGSGPAVLLLHGFGESLISWRGLFDSVARAADVIALDLPGFGLSSKPPTGYATDSLALAVLMALDALGIERAVLVGHSLGGAVAAAAALLRPNRVAGLVLVDPAVVLTPWIVPTQGRQDAAVEGLRAAIAEYEALRPRFTPPHDRDWLEEDDSAAAYAPSDDPAYRIALQSVLREFDFSFLGGPRADSVRAPTLIVWGEFDQLIPVTVGERLAAAIPRARFEVVGRAWHRPHVERPNAVAGLIVRFLDTH